MCACGVADEGCYPDYLIGFLFLIVAIAIGWVDRIRRLLR